MDFRAFRNASFHFRANLRSKTLGLWKVPEQRLGLTGLCCSHSPRAAACWPSRTASPIACCPPASQSLQGPTVLPTNPSTLSFTPSSLLVMPWTRGHTSWVAEIRQGRIRAVIQTQSARQSDFVSSWLRAGRATEGIRERCLRSSCSDYL